MTTLGNSTPNSTLSNFTNATTLFYASMAATLNSARSNRPSSEASENSTQSSPLSSIKTKRLSPKEGKGPKRRNSIARVEVQSPVVEEKITEEEAIEAPAYLKGLDPKAIHFEQWYPKLERILREVHKETNLLDERLLHAYFLFARFTSTTSYGKELAEIWNKRLSKYEYGKIYARIMEQFYLRDVDFESESQFDSDPDAKAAYNNYYHAVKAIWNGSDSDDGLCCQIWSYGIAEHCLKILSKPPDARNTNSFFSNPVITYFTKAHISTLMNSLRRCPENGAKFRELNGPEILLTFTETTEDEMIPVLATCVIAYGSNEEEIKKMNIGERIVDFLLNHVLYKAILMKNRRYRGFSIAETLEVINKLAAQESIQEKLCDARILQTFLKILVKPEEEENELFQVARLFWTISFNQKVREEMKKSIPNLVAELKRLEEHPDKCVKKCVLGALWNLEGARPKTAAVGRAISAKPPIYPSVAGASYIMISYDWRHKEVVVPLNQAIKAAGYRTWIDIEQMCKEEHQKHL